MTSERRRILRVGAGEAPATRLAAQDDIVREAGLVLEAGGASVATIMRTPGADLELVRGLLVAEGLAPPGAAVQLHQRDADRVAVDLPAAAFAARGLLSTSACGVCGRAVIADLELRAREVTADLVVPAAVLAALPAALRARQEVFAATGGLHAAALADATGALVAVREDVGRHNAVDKVVGWAVGAGVDRGRLVLVLSGRLGFELVHKAVMAGIPIVVAVSAPTTLAIDVAERFGVAACGFVRDARMNVYSHPWRVG